MIRSKRNQTQSSRLGARRMIAAIVFSATTLQSIATHAEDSMQRLSKPEELARIAPMRAIGLRFAPPKTLSSLSPRADHPDALTSPIHPPVPMPPMALPQMILPPTPDHELAAGSLPLPNMPSHAGTGSNIDPDSVWDSPSFDISTASQVPTVSSSAVPASMSTPVASMSTPVDSVPPQDRVSFRLGEASGSKNSTNPKSTAASQPTSSESSDSSIHPRDARSLVAPPPRSQPALAHAGPSQTRMPQHIKPQAVRTQSANAAPSAANNDQPAIQNDGTKLPQGPAIKVTKADGITQHTPVRLSFSNDSVTAVPVARSVQAQTIMRSGSEIPVSVRSLAPNSKVLQATKASSQPALVAAVSLDPESAGSVDAEDPQDPANATDTMGSADTETAPTLAERDAPSKAADPSPSPLNRSAPAIETNSRLKVDSRSGFVGQAVEPSGLAGGNDSSYLAQDSGNQPNSAAQSIPSPIPTATPHAVALPLAPTLASPTLAAPRPAMPTPAILASRSQVANSESNAPVNVADVPKQGRVSLASNASGGLRVVPVESNPDSMRVTESHLAAAAPAPEPSLASEALSLPAASLDATHPTLIPGPAETRRTRSGSSPTPVEVATPTIMEADTPSTAVSLTLPEVAVAATTDDAVQEEGLEDRPPTLSSRPIGSAATGAPREAKEPVIPRGPIVTTGSLESGVVPESAPRLEIESQSANEFLVEGKITSIHIVDPNVCRTVASDGKIFVVGNELGETSIALRTAERTEPIFVRVAVVTAWQNAKQGVADIDQLRATIANVAPEARLRIQPQSDGSLWVIGTVDSNDKAKRVMELTRKLVLVPVVDKLEVR
jgi:hypothetical protein